MRVTRRIVVTGRVQGVWYRGWTLQQAQAIGLGGWVSNCLDGSVEIVAAGPEHGLAELIARCRRGPPAARVDQVSVEDYDGNVADKFVVDPSRK